MKILVQRAVGLALMVGSGALFSPGVSLAQAPTPITPGEIKEATLAWDAPAVFSFDAESAGVLTVVVRSLDGTDLVLVVTDGDGQPLPEGRSDQDLGGDSGAEQFAVTLPRAGAYQVKVEAFGGGGGSFKLGVSWLPYPDLALPADPDGSPGTANPIHLDQDARTDQIDPGQGDNWDWYVLKADKAGTVTVATRAEEGDLILEAFEPGEFGEALERSDQDLQGNGGNEAVTLVVEVGDEFFFRVSAFSGGGGVPYRLQIGFIPNE
ncbi:MAG: hypothetical protein PVJ76_16315 [Gemmatimonadota bacterium]